MLLRERAHCSEEISVIDGAMWALVCEETSVVEGYKDTRSRGNKGLQGRP